MMKIKLMLIILLLFSGSAYPDEISRTRLQETADRLFSVIQSGGDHMGYSRFALDFLERVYDTTPEKTKNRYVTGYLRRERERRREELDPFSLLSGGLAIRESLQLESIRSGIPEGDEVELSQLRGPVIASHPFKKMLKGRKYKIFPLAASTPEDFYYVHFNNMSGSLDFFDYLGSVGGSLHKRFSPVSVDYMLKEKILAQLALRENRAARRFYNLVIEEMAITGSDPFIMEGTDISILYRLKNISLFKMRIKSYRKYFRKTFHCTSRKIYISGTAAEHLSSPDRKINSYLLFLDTKTVLITNSRKAAEIILSTHRKKRPSLADASDFRYMRSIYPADRKKEDGFIYLSDPFIRYLTGPSLRIKEARRMNEAARLTALEKILLLFHQVMKRKPASIDELTAFAEGPGLTGKERALADNLKNNPLMKTVEKISGYNRNSWYRFRYGILAASGAKRPYGKEQKDEADRFISQMKNTYLQIRGRSAETPGEVLSLINRKDAYGKTFKGFSISPDGYSLASSSYGRHNFMTPNIEITLKKVSEKEAAGYRRFIKEYNNFWREYFDPIGIRFKLKDGIRVDTCILPLINNSIYNTLTGLIGGKPVRLDWDRSLPGDIFTLALKIRNMKMLDKAFLEDFSGRTETGLKLKKILPSAVFGDQVNIHMGDTLPLVDFDGKHLTGRMLRWGISKSDIFFGLFAWSLFHPLRVSLPLKKTKEAGILLDYLISTKAFMSDRYLKIQRYTYKYREYNIKVAKLTFFKTISFRFYTSITNKTLHISTNEEYLKRALAFEKGNKWKSLPDRIGNIAAVYRPGEMKQEKSLYVANVMESAQNASFRNFGTIKLLNYLFPGRKNLPDLSLKYFGFKPVCPMGGEYSIDRKTGTVTNSLFGSLYRPEIRFREIADEGLKRYFSTKRVKLNLRFTPEGIMTLISTE